MKKNARKILAMLLALVTVVLCCAACAGQNGGASYTDDENKQVNLVIAFPFATTEDLDKVQDAINEELKTLLPNTTIELLCDEAMSDKWTLWMSGKKVIDICHSGFAMDLATEINKRSFLALDELIEEYAPTIRKEQEELYTQLYQGGMTNGELYGIPCVQVFVNDTAEIRYHNEHAKYYDPAKIVELTHGDKHTTEGIYVYLDTVFAAIKEGEGEFWLAAKRMAQSLPTLATKGYTMIEGTNLCYDSYAEKPTIIDFHTTDEYKTFIKWMNKWFNDGYISKDVLSSATFTEEFMPAMGSLYGTDENYRKNDANWTMVSIENPDDKIYTSTKVGEIQSYMSIPFTSQNPARAMKFLELIRTPEGAVIANLMAYGLEGEHYEKRSDTEITAFDYSSQGNANSAYSIPQWMIGNNFNMYLVNPYEEAQRVWAADYFANVVPNIQRGPLFGFSFDLTKMKVKVSNLRGINTEFEPQLGSGIMNNYEEIYNTMLERSAAAGIADVIAELQKQADDYIASK